ncbi:hypothetical protein BC937DRAFT_88440 [Endogone sp. FLAS-F59071]|nr:hypothetical protein BC937DRAFT_88440 [Endogone sp. FLAS-F59071]|eukprot:RUS22564.1 hypothetical protein BC937DRAFT_88440 [Endogone sp. FLAS-F59071]
MATAAVSQNVFQRFLNSPAGPKTIHFWAPASKWVKHTLSPPPRIHLLVWNLAALVIAGVGDLARPADKLSVYQNTCIVFHQSILLQLAATTILGAWRTLSHVVNPSFTQYFCCRCDSTHPDRDHLDPVLDGHYPQELDSLQRQHFRRSHSYRQTDEYKQKVAAENAETVAALA